MDEPQQIAVLLTCHNRCEKTLTCLKALFEAIIPKGYILEVFLVDDGSIDETGKAVGKNYPQVNVIQGNGKLYWNRGMRLAWETAAKAKKYDFYLWLNDDTIIKNNCLSVLIQTSEYFQNKSIVVGTTSAVNNPDHFTYGGRNKNGRLITPTDNIKQCQCFNGNIVLFPKYVHKKVGTNDPVFHHYLGDIDYGLRAAKIGIQSIIAPEILGECDEHESLATWCNPQQSFRKRWHAFRTPLGHNPEEFFIFEKRHGGLGKALLHYLTNHLRVVCPKLWKKNNEHVSFGNNPTL